jgi:hypothetical protein
VPFSFLFSIIFLSFNIKKSLPSRGKPEYFEGSQTYINFRQMQRKGKKSFKKLFQEQVAGRHALYTQHSPLTAQRSLPCSSSGIML